MLCRHCQTAAITRPRRLCWSCYNQEAIRELYAPRTRNLAEPGRQELPLPDLPTRARPGTRAKLRVLRRRAQQRVELFHPRDQW
jgi:hypothetical protein